jgi:DNA (cytosine-5)-methyltransferase 1
MGIPQRRHRVFFIAIRKDIDFDVEGLDMSFNYETITYGEIKAGEIEVLGENTDYRRLTLASLPEEKDIGAVNMRLHKKLSGFQTFLIDDNSLVPTLRSKPDIIDRNAIAFITKETIANAQTFPQDYDFISNTRANIGYICGMSVPPIMIKRIVTRLIESGLFDYKLGGHYESNN